MTSKPSASNHVHQCNDMALTAKSIHNVHNALVTSLFTSITQTLLLYIWHCSFVNHWHLINKVNHQLSYLINELNHPIYSVCLHGNWHVWSSFLWVCSSRTSFWRHLQHLPIVSSESRQKVFAKACICEIEVTYMDIEFM